MRSKDYHLNEWRKLHEEKIQEQIRSLVQENILLRTELNRAIEALSKTQVNIPEKWRSFRSREWRQ